MTHNGQAQGSNLTEPARKVLMVAYVFPPIAYVGTYRTIRFCRYLPENGWFPHVLTIEETSDLDNDYRLFDRLPEEIQIYRTKTVDFWRNWEKRRARKKPAANLEKKSVLNAEKINHVAPPFLNRLKQKLKDFIWALVTTPDHMVFWIPFGVVKGAKILQREKCDVIYTTSPPHSEHIIGYILSKIFNKKWVADFRDPMLDSSGYSPSPIRYGIDKFLEKLVVKNAHKVIIISRSYLEKMYSRYPWAQKKFVVLPNGYDPEIYYSARVEPFKKFTIIYAGSFYANRKPDFFLKGLKEWLSKRPEIRNTVQVIFYGQAMEKAKQIVESEQLRDVVQFPGMIPQDELIPKQKGAHLLLLIIGFDPESRGTVTSKVFEYMACHRPILAIIPEGDAADILREYEKLYWIAQEDLNLLIDSLNKAYTCYQQEHGENSLVSKLIYLQQKDPFDARMQTKTLSSLFS